MSSTGEVEFQAPVVEQTPATETENQVTEMEAPEIEEPVEQPEGGVIKEEEKPVKETKKKASKEKKPKTRVHPPYFQMIKEAITSINEKGGSSPYAIAKYMEQKHKSVLPSNFRKILGLQLKNSVTKGKLIKIKASYKLSEAGKRDNSTTITKAARANAGKSKNNKRRRPKSKAVSKIENPNATSVVAAAAMVTTRARRSKRASAPAKPKQLKSIKPPVVKKTKKISA